MKTLIYDNECPLCSAYTNAFVKSGLLEKEGRKSFDEVSPEIFKKVDKQRCNNEIPLVDEQTGEVLYGIDALLGIIGNKLPLIKFIGELKPVNWFLKKLYNLITFNRKIIVAVESRTHYDCSPAFSVKYQLLFLMGGLLFNSFMWELYYQFFKSLDAGHLSNTAWIIAHYVIVALNISIAACLGLRKGLAYLGQVNMLALISMLLFLPLYLVNTIVVAPTSLYWFGLGLISFFMSREYIRRMRFARVWATNKKLVVLNMISVALAVYFLTA